MYICVKVATVGVHCHVLVIVVKNVFYVFFYFFLSKTCFYVYYSVCIFSLK